MFIHVIDNKSFLFYEKNKNKCLETEITNNEQRNSSNSFMHLDYNTRPTILVVCICIVLYRFTDRERDLVISINYCKTSEVLLIS